MHQSEGSNTRPPSSNYGQLPVVHPPPMRQLPSVPLFWMPRTPCNQLNWKKPLLILMMMTLRTMAGVVAPSAPGPIVLPFFLLRRSRSPMVPPLHRRRLRLTAMVPPPPPLMTTITPLNLLQVVLVEIPRILTIPEILTTRTWLERSAWNIPTSLSPRMPTRRTP